MIVLDASAALFLLVADGIGERIAERTHREGGSLHAPHLIDVEVAHTLRRLVRRGELGEWRALAALTDLDEMDLHRYAHGPLLHRAWELRDRVSMYDGVYVALAEALEATLVTSDRALARAAAHLAAVEVY